jgi:hypothetical protein
LPDPGIHPLGEVRHKGDQDGLLYQRHPDPGFHIGHLSREHHGSPTSFDQRGLRYPLGKGPASNHRQTSRSWDSSGTRCKRQWPSPKRRWTPSVFKILVNLAAPICRQVVLTGLIAAFFKAVPLLRLKGRWHQISLNRVYSSELDLQKTVILSPQAIRDLNWIISLSPHQCFAILWFLSLEVQMDASKIGYSIWFQGFLHQGLWDSITVPLHVNVLETTAFWIFLACILPKLSKQCIILWRVDNTTALAYVKKEGGTWSPQVLEVVEKVLAQAHQMSIRSSFPQGKTSWQTQRLASKRFQTGSFIP